MSDASSTARVRILPAGLALLLLAAASFLPATSASAVSAGSPSPLAGFPDNATLRAELAPDLILGTRTAAFAWKEAALTRDGLRSRVSVLRDGGAGTYAVVFENPLGAGFSPLAPGSWTFRRSLGDSSFVDARLSFTGEADSYALFRPLGPDRVVMDLVLAGGLIARDVPLRMAWKALVASPIEAVRDLCPVSVPWALMAARQDSVGAVASLAARVASFLPLPYADDGALDEGGRVVFIEDLSPQDPALGLNCSGFAKWIIDGILLAEGGRMLPIAPLKAPTTDFAGSSIAEAAMDVRDPRFGLDWVRNLVLALETSRRPASLPRIGDNDVTDAFFAFLAGPKGYSSAPPRVEGAGYAVGNLRALLSCLAAARPEEFYFAVVSSVGGEPPLRAFHHVAALFPWRDATGALRVVVLESGEKTSLERFMAVNAGRLAYLVAVKAESRFEAPPLPAPWKGKS